MRRSEDTEFGLKFDSSNAGVNYNSTTGLRTIGALDDQLADLHPVRPDSPATRRR
jgi:hypothetical protein